MSFRIFRGNVTSLNGWRMCNADECDWYTVPGTDVSLQIRRGIPATILLAFARRFNELIEPLRDDDSACWTETNDVDTSNHPAGIACDFNWNSHPFHEYGTFSPPRVNPDKLPALRHLLDVEFRGCVGWGGDWGGNPQDEMHFEIAFQEGWVDDNDVFHLDIDPRLVALAKDLGGDVQPSVLPLSRAETYALATIKEGQRLGITPRGIIIALAVELVETNLTMYANSNDPVSLDLPHDAVGSDHMSSGTYQQQPPWGSLEDRMDVTRSTTIFFTVDNGPGVRGLTKIRETDGTPIDYNNDSRSPGQLAQKVQGSAFPDRYDQRMNEAGALYDRLVGLVDAPIDQPAQGDDSVAMDQPVQSLSPFRDLGEGPRWTPAQMIVADDGFEHPQYSEWAAARGDSRELARLNTIAAIDPVANPDRADDVKLAKACLDRIQTSVPSQTATQPMPDTPVQGLQEMIASHDVITPLPAVVGQVEQPAAKTETVVVRPITQDSIPRSTVIHSIITILGSVLTMIPWVLQSFGDHLGTTPTLLLSGGFATGSALLDFLVKTEKQVTPEEKEQILNAKSR